MALRLRGGPFRLAPVARPGTRSRACRRHFVRRPRRRAPERAPRRRRSRRRRIRGLRRTRRPRGARRGRDAVADSRRAHLRDHGRAAREDGHRREPVPRGRLPVRHADERLCRLDRQRDAVGGRAPAGAPGGRHHVPRRGRRHRSPPRRLRPGLARQARARLCVRERSGRRLDRRDRRAEVVLTPARGAGRRADSRRRGDASPRRDRHDRRRDRELRPRSRVPRGRRDTHPARRRRRARMVRALRAGRWRVLHGVVPPRRARPVARARRALRRRVQRRAGLPGGLPAPPRRGDRRLAGLSRLRARASSPRGLCRARGAGRAPLRVPHEGDPLHDPERAL